MDKIYASNIIELQKFLNNIKSFSMKFIQTDQSDKISIGTLKMLKPNKVRIDYTYPNEIVIIFNNKLITIYDVELNHISHIRKYNPFLMFTEKNFLLKEVIDVHSDNEYKIIFSIFLETGEELVINFDKINKSMFSLYKIINMNNKIVWHFDDIEYNPKLDDDIFYIHKREEDKIEYFE